VQTRAVVTRVSGAQAYVCAQEPGGCEACDEGGGCGLARLSHWLAADESGICVPSGTLQTGDEVVLELADGALGRAACLAYLLPLVGLLVGAGLGTHWNPPGWGPDAAAAAAGLLGAALAAFAARKMVAGYDMRWNVDPQQG
jgi:sigma-E factor negative regulatory protein RseC